MPTDPSDWKCRSAKVIVCLDGRLRAFTDAGVCLGVVTPEEEIATDPDADPIGIFHGLIFAAILLMCFLTVLWLGFRGIDWFRGVAP